MEIPNFEKNINKAYTLPTSFYTDPEIYHLIKSEVFEKSWLYASDTSVIKEMGDVHPIEFMPELIDEPLFFSKDNSGNKHCLSNVCTHRGNILVADSTNKKRLSCSYHGRCFQLDGKFKSMPSFEGVEDFPNRQDDLKKVSFAEWLNMFFVSLNPKIDFAEIIKPIQSRLSWLDTSSLVFDSEKSKDYFLDANWLLYCENYLEGFHVPFVHPGLSSSLALNQYDYELFENGVLQLGIAKEGETCFQIPKESEDYGKNIFAYYYFLFPNLMLNFYPWGLSLNVLYPQGLEKTKISFRTYLFPDAKHEFDAKGIHDTEMEDEAIVLQVQKGVKSRFYKKGRYAPEMEKGLHHFHGMLLGSLGA